MLFRSTINYFGASQGVIGSDLVYKIIGLNNNKFIVNLTKSRNDIFNYVLRKTYIKITYTDKTNTQKIIYFNSKGSLLDQISGEKYFNLYYSLNKIYLDLYNTNFFEISDITSETIDNLLKNNFLKNQVNSLKN